MAEENIENDLEAAIDDRPDDGMGDSGNKKKIILFVLVPILLLSLTGAGLYFTGMLDGLLRKGPDCEKILETIESGADDAQGTTMQDIPDECLIDDTAEDAHGNGPQAPGAFLEIPNLIVNFNSTTGRPKFLKLSVQIEVDSESDKSKLEDGMPRIIDHFQTYLRELRLEDLKGSSGLYRMRIELKSRVGSAIPDVTIRDVLFQEILIQQ